MNPSVTIENQYIKLVKELGGVLGDELPLYSSKYSRKDYTLHQHVILLVLRSKERKPYRDFVEWIEVSDSIRQVLSIKKVPHYTTLQKVADRLPPGLLERLMGVVGRGIIEPDYIAGIDGTGFSLDFASRYYCKRINRLSKRRSFLKASIVGDMKTQAILACRLRLKRRHDGVDFVSALRKIRDTKPATVVADKAYDGEDNLRFVIHELIAKPVIPLHDRGRPAENTRDKHRRQLNQNFPLEVYHQRSKIETIISVVKRKYGDTIYGRKHRTKKNELYFKLIAYNCHRAIRFVGNLFEGFYKAQPLLKVERYRNQVPVDEKGAVLNF